MRMRLILVNPIQRRKLLRFIELIKRITLLGRSKGRKKTEQNYNGETHEGEFEDSIIRIFGYSVIWIFGYLDIRLFV